MLLWNASSSHFSGSSHLLSCYTCFTSPQSKPDWGLELWHLAFENVWTEWESKHSAASCFFSIPVVLTLGEHTSSICFRYPWVSSLISVSWWLGSFKVVPPQDRSHPEKSQLACSSGELIKQLKGGGGQGCVTMALVSKYPRVVHLVET